ncbi:MAG: BBE domain-containing protein [Ktedonobacteraceae bacterium]
MKFWRDFILTAPKEINGWFAFLTVPPAPPFPEQLHMQKMCAIVWCSTAPMEWAEELLKPIRAFRTPAVDFVGYRDNYTRLAQIKATYDPSNLFHVNQNIKPTM